MGLPIGFLIFLTFLTSVYAGINFYVLWRTSRFFHIPRNIWFYVAWIILTLSAAGVVVLCRGPRGLIASVVHYICGVWMGFAFILFFLYLPWEILKFLIKVPPRKAGLVIISIAVILTIYSLLNALNFRVRKNAFSSSKIKTPARIVHISDAHLGPINRKGYLEKVVKKINSLEPDAVFITGDFVDCDYPYIEDDFSPLSEIESRVYFSMGNHERYSDMSKIAPLIEVTGTRFLRNEKISEEKWDITAIDDADDYDQVSKIIKDIPLDPERFNIVMYHRPAGMEAARKAGGDLFLCGHVHGGQIVPFNFITGWFFYRPVRGFHNHNGMGLNVSTGTGYWGPPLRLGSFNEIVVIDLLPG